MVALGKDDIREKLPEGEYHVSRKLDGAALWSTYVRETTPKKGVTTMSFGDDDEGYGTVLGDGVVPPGREHDARVAALNCPEHAISLAEEA